MYCFNFGYTLKPNLLALPSASVRKPAKPPLRHVIEEKLPLAIRLRVLVLRPAFDTQDGVRLGPFKHLILGLSVVPTP